MSERLAKAIDAMRLAIANREADSFAIPASRFHPQRAKNALKARDAASRRKFIRPDNAHALIAQLPSPGDSLHAVVRGDFVIGDMLPALLATIGHVAHLRCATLGLSVKNAETLRNLVTSGRVGRITLLCSHYFRGTEKLAVFYKLTTVLEGVAEIKVARSHAKLILAANETGDAYVFETSANLRSSGSVEQISVFNDRDLHDFHAGWMDEIKPDDSTRQPLAE